MTIYDLKPEINIKGVSNGFSGFVAIAEQLSNAIRAQNKEDIVLAIECYPGVNYTEIKKDLFPLLSPNMTIFTDDYAYTVEEVQEKIKDVITEDRVFGVLSQYTIDQFFHENSIEKAKKEIKDSSGLTIVYGMGTTVISVPDIIVYADLPRWEIRCRYRDENLKNWKTDNADEDELRKYKRGYFFEWGMADRLKKKIYNQVDYLLDTNKKEQPAMIDGKSYRKALSQVAQVPFRLVPFFDASVWGGQWMKEKFNLDPEVENYGWAFDGVPEENSIILNFKGTKIEIPAINAVFAYPDELLGSKVRWRFGTSFPIRFDYLDTMGGRNLSLQVHPLVEYAQDTFGIHYTQDESYYILEATDNSTIYLGVKNNTDKDELVADLRKATSGDFEFPDEKYINVFPVKKHDHYSIPAGTIHCGGPDTIVLEISATPNNFTFKLWDWGRTGLDGIPRPVHIDHGEPNILVERDTDFVLEQLVSSADSKFENLSNQEGIQTEKTGLHELEFIETHRHWFSESVVIKTHESVNMLNLVEGTSVLVESLNGEFDALPINYGETFIVPESVKKYRITNAGDTNKKTAVIQAFVRNL
ncbi:class I mannose-6-phosphate isomerase [Oceanobacillus jeddahense]